MSLHRDLGGHDRTRPEPLSRVAGPQEERRSARPGILGTGTFACPECDAPVAPGPRPLTPSDWVGCPYCRHVGVVRDFLSLETPARPARVQVRVAYRPR